MTRAGTGRQAERFYSCQPPKQTARQPAQAGSWPPAFHRGAAAHRNRGACPYLVGGAPR